MRCDHAWVQVTCCGRKWPLSCPMEWCLEAMVTELSVMAMELLSAEPNMAAPLPPPSPAAPTEIWMEAPEISDDEKEERREQFQAVTGAADQIADTLLEVAPAPPRSARMIAERCRREMERACTVRSSPPLHTAFAPRLTNVEREWVGERPRGLKAAAQTARPRVASRGRFPAFRRRPCASCNATSVPQTLLLARGLRCERHGRWRG